MADTELRLMLLRRIDARYAQRRSGAAAARLERAAKSEKPIQQLIHEFWRRALDRDDFGSTDDFFDLGGESIAVLQVLADIEKAFGKKLPASTMLKFPTIKKLAACVAEEHDVSGASPLELLQPRGARRPLFCVPGVGGDVLNLMELARHLAPTQPLVGLRAPGADGNGEPMGRIEDLAAYYLDAIQAFQPEPPYCLGGFSFGGSVALEMAQRLHAQGKAVAFLGIIDHTLPPLRYRRFKWSATLPFDFVVNTARWFHEDVWQVGAGKRLRTLRQKFGFLGATLLSSVRKPAAASGACDVRSLFGADALPESMRPVMATHYQALRDYRPKPYPGSVTLFRARTRPLLRLHGRDLGWTKIAAGGLSIVDIPGNHETILKEPRVQVLADALNHHLLRAQGGHRVNRG
jgi:aspartate racemase